MKKRFLTLLRIIITSKCWVRVGVTNKEWDESLNQALDAPTFSEYERFSIKLNGIKLWIGNYPYSYGHKYHDPSNEVKLPTRATVFKLKDAIHKYRSKQKEK